MYGLITRLTALPGRREALAQMIVGGMAYRAGLISYVVAEDARASDALWVTEVWFDEAAHKASLSAETKAFAARCWPLVATMDEPVVTRPVGGLGLD